MAQLDNAFDSSQHEDMTGFDPLPKGKYLLKVVETEIKRNKKDTGNILKIKMEVLQGNYKGRFIFRNLNITNPNPVAVELAQKELATLCRAVGKGVIQDSNELHNIPFGADLGVKPPKGDNEAEQKVNKYFSVKPKQQPVQESQIDDVPGW